ncbi:hypothetical protein [Bartonella sp. WD12.1]|uniref:hypothetical protein n=1 Tax=Bartonella sp. WD12.1 TaxID=1933903 RepID=UPI000999E348|nr:hypothetical protein [Bartonella sp. WD12.1]OPB29804.1 hypothetical protein BWD121_008350 [Bartonella sp. WD12.1]
MNKQVSVDNYEILLVICDDDYPYAQFGPLEETEIRDIISGLDNIECILRIDLQSNRYDDLSEDIAELYVQKYLNDNDHYYFLENSPYPFIADSWAYSDVLDKIRERENTNPFYSNCQQ